jgi:TolA-binding protein
MTAACFSMLASVAHCADAANDQFAVAAAHYQNKRWHLAAEEFQEFLQGHLRHKKAAEARFFAAECYLQLRQYAKARDEYQRFLRDHPHDLRATQAEFRQGEAAYFLGQRDAAQVELEAFLRKHPGDPLAAYTLAYLGQLAIDRGDYPSAQRLFSQVIRQFPTSPLIDDCHFGLARALEKTGAHQQAIAIFSNLASQKSKLADDCLFHIAACHYAQCDYEQALAALDDFDARFADSPLAPRGVLLRAWSLFQLRRYDRAIPLLQQLAGNQHVGVEAQYWLALTYKSSDNEDAAIKTLQSLLANHANHELGTAARFHLGDLLLRRGRYREADDEFSHVLATAADSQWADDCLLGRARAALAQSDLHTVAALAREYELVHPGGHLRTEFVRILARAQLAAGNAEQAIETIRPLLGAGDLSGVAPQDRFLLAEALERGGRYQEALDQLDRLSEADQQLVGAALLAARGLALVGLKRYNEALGCFEHYSKSEPDGAANGLVLAQSAICHLRLGDVDSARQAYQQLRARHGSDAVVAPATERLAELALSANHLELAQQWFEVLASLDPASGMPPRGLFGLARVAYRRKQWDRAAEKLATLLNDFPNSELAAEALILRGSALERLERLDAAAHLYQEAFTRHADTPVAARAMLAAARLHRRCQQTAEAANLYRKLLEQSHTVVPIDAVLYELAWLLRDAGQPEEANRNFARLHAEFPNSAFWPDATYRLAEEARVHGDLRRADDLATDLLKAESAGSLREYALFLQGQIAAEQQRWTIVEVAMRDLLQDYPNGKLADQARFWSAEALYRQNRLSEAETSFQRLDTAGGVDPALRAVVRLRCAQILARNKDWQAAYEKALTVDKNAADFKQQHEVDYVLGRCLANQAKFEEAREAYRRAIRSPHGAKTETAAMAQWMIGESYFHQKDYDKAIKEYLRVEILYAFPTWQAAALLQAGKCYELLGQPASAADLYRRLLERYPDTQFADEANRRLRLAQQSSSSKRS